MNGAKNKTFLLSGIFFLTTLFLLSANITAVGVTIYQYLFYIPGFTMFRNFIGQWLFVFSFFYALLFGQALWIILKHFSKRVVIGLFFMISILLVLSSWQFISGGQINKIILTSPQKRIPIVMDKNFEKSLYYVKHMPDEGKILILPFSDAFYELVPGSNDGLYVSSSILSYIGGKYSFSGYQTITPFSDTFLQLAKEQKYEDLKKLFGILNINYIYYNDDASVYDHIVPDYYQYVRQFLPSDQKAYKEFLQNFSKKEIFSSGHYHIYKLENNYFLTRFYIADKIIQYIGSNKENTQNINFFVNTTMTKHTAYVTKETCQRDKVCQLSPRSSSSEISFEMIDPTKYKVTMHNVMKPTTLVFSNAFHGSWKLVSENTARESSAKHFLTNGYANAWYLTPQDFGNKKEEVLFVTMTGQKLFYICAVISLLFVVSVSIWGIVLFRPQIFVVIIRQIYAFKK